MGSVGAFNIGRKWLSSLKKMAATYPHTRYSETILASRVGRPRPKFSRPFVMSGTAQEPHASFSFRRNGRLSRIARKLSTASYSNYEAAAHPWHRGQRGGSTNQAATCDAIDRDDTTSVTPLPMRWQGRPPGRD